MVKTNVFPGKNIPVNRRFGGACRVYLQGVRVLQATNQHKSGDTMEEALPPTCRLTYIPEKTLFITTTVNLKSYP
jgi:hypothetical protein